MAVGGKFNLDDSNVLRARLTNNSDVAVALTHTLRPGKLISMVPFFQTVLSRFLFQDSKPICHCRAI